MKYMMKTLLLTTTMLSALSAAESTSARIGLRDLPVEILGQIVDRVDPAEQTNLKKTEDNLLNSKIQQAMEVDVNRKVSKFNAQDLYDKLPIDKTDKRSVYNLIHYADILLKAEPLQRQDVIEFLVALDIDAAIQMKFEGLLYQKYGYEQDTAAARALLEEQIAKGKQWAVQMKFDGLLYRKYGYEQYKAAARALLEEQIAKGNQWAIQMKFEGLLYQKYGYEQDTAAAHAFLDESIKKGHEWAIQKKIELLFDMIDSNKRKSRVPSPSYFVGDAGRMNQVSAYHEEQRKEAYALLDESIKKGHEWAIQKKIELLFDMIDSNKRKSRVPSPSYFVGDAGRMNQVSAYHEEQRKEAYALLDESIKKGRVWAIQMYYKRLHKVYGSNRNIYDYIEYEIKKGNQGAIFVKFYGLLDGEYGYKKIPAVAYAFLAEQIKKGNQFMITMKIKGLLTGTYGYQKDHQAVLRYFGIQIIDSQSTASSSHN